MSVPKAAGGIALVLAGGVALAALGGSRTDVAPTTDIKLSQAGYPTRGRKLAFVVAKGPASGYAVVPTSGGGAVFSGRLSEPRPDADSGDHVQTADFSSLERPGTYVIDVRGVGRSFAFAIGDDVLARPLYLALRAFYGQRCGTAVDLGPDFPAVDLQVRCGKNRRAGRRDCTCSWPTRSCAWARPVQRPIGDRAPVSDRR